MSADLKKSGKNKKQNKKGMMENKYDRNVSIALFDDVDKHVEKRFRIKKQDPISMKHDRFLSHLF